jgi:hypothetical protein
VPGRAEDDWSFHDFFTARANQLTEKDLADVTEDLAFGHLG